MRVIVITLACLVHISSASRLPSLKANKRLTDSLGSFMLASNAATSIGRGFPSIRKSQMTRMSLNPNHHSDAFSPFGTTRASTSARNFAKSVPSGTPRAPQAQTSSAQQVAQGAATRMLGYNDEMIKSIEDLRQKREEWDLGIAMEEEEKAKAQKELSRLMERMQAIDESLSQKIEERNDYDQLVQESEAAYMSIVKSSHDLAQLLRREAINLSSKKGKPSAEKVSPSRTAPKANEIASLERKQRGEAAKAAASKLDSKQDSSSTEDLEAMFKRKINGLGH